MKKNRLKFDLVFVISLNLVFSSGSSLKSESAELFLVGLSTSEWFVGRNSNCVKTNETWINPVKLTLHLGANWTALLFKGLWWVSFSCQHHFEASLWSKATRVALFALSVGSLQRRHPLIASSCLLQIVCHPESSRLQLELETGMVFMAAPIYTSELQIWLWPRLRKDLNKRMVWPTSLPRSACRQEGTGSEPLPFAPKPHS